MYNHQLMKQTDEILHNHEQETSQFSSHEQVINNDLLANEFLYDQQVLRTQIKEKYKERLEDLNNNQQKKRFCLQFINNLVLLLFYILEQLWIEIIPQYFRGRYFAQKSPEIMEKYNQLNCGNMSLFLSRIKKEGKHFFIILEQKITQDQECFDIEENLFDNSDESNQKLNYILQSQTMGLNAEDLQKLENEENSPVRFGNFMKPNTKFPLLLVCRYNFLEELKVMGEIELSSLSKESFIELLDEVKKNIFELKNLQSECKRQVLMEILNPNRQVSS